MRPLETLQAFDRYLEARTLRFEAVIIGGAALNLLGVISRVTKDCDVLSPTVPPDILKASQDFASELRKRGEILADDWLNNGPSSLVPLLPAGWEVRVQLVFAGQVIQLHSLGRIDLLRSKLFALCDRGIDLGDFLALSPTADELNIILPWLEIQDANPDWPTHAKTTLSDVARRLGYVL